jgi:hypothetical protein
MSTALVERISWIVAISRRANTGVNDLEREPKRIPATPNAFSLNAATTVLAVHTFGSVVYLPWAVSLRGIPGRIEFGSNGFELLHVGE